MRKIILYIGLAILILGVGPFLACALLFRIGIVGPDFNPMGLALLAYVSFWPGVVLTTLGIFLCVYNLSQS